MLSEHVAKSFRECFHLLELSHNRTIVHCCSGFVLCDKIFILHSLNRHLTKQVNYSVIWDSLFIGLQTATWSCDRNPNGHGLTFKKWNQYMFFFFTEEETLNTIIPLLLKLLTVSGFLCFTSPAAQDSTFHFQISITQINWWKASWMRSRLWENIRAVVHHWENVCARCAGVKVEITERLAVITFVWCHHSDACT